MNDLDSLKKRASKVKSILDQKIGVRQTHLNNSFFSTSQKYSSAS